MKELEKKVSHFYKEKTKNTNEHRHTTNELFNDLDLPKSSAPMYQKVMRVRNHWNRIEASKFYKLWLEQGKLTGNILLDWKKFLKMFNNLGMFYTISIHIKTKNGKFIHGFYQPSKVPDKLEWDDKSFRRPIRMAHNRFKEGMIMRPDIPLSSGQSLAELGKLLSELNILTPKEVEKIIELITEIRE